LPYVTDWVGLVNKKKRGDFGIPAEAEYVLATDPYRQTAGRPAFAKAMADKPGRLSIVIPLGEIATSDDGSIRWKSEVLFAIGQHSSCRVVDTAFLVRSNRPNKISV
jgi:hypothetical protein